MHEHKVQCKQVLMKMSCLLLLCLWWSASALSFGGSPQLAINKKNLKNAIANAKTAEDHERLAAYYQQQAKHLEEKAKQAEELADYYKHAWFPPKYPTPYERVKGLAEYYHWAARKDLTKADLQKKLAVESERRTPAPK